MVKMSVKQRIVLEIIEECHPKYDYRREGVLWGDIKNKALSKGLDEEEIEDAIGRLLDKGIIYQPSKERLRLL